MLPTPPWDAEDGVPPAKPAAKAPPRAVAIPTVVRPRRREHRKYPPAWLESLGAGAALALVAIWVIFVVAMLWAQSALLEGIRPDDAGEAPGGRPRERVELPRSEAMAREQAEGEGEILAAFTWMAGASAVLIAALFGTAGITWVVYRYRTSRDAP